jgi:hypothetical protein
MNFIPVKVSTLYSGVPVAPHSDFAVFVGWSIGAREMWTDEDRTKLLASVRYSSLAELFRNRGSPPPWPARCPVVPPRGGAGLVENDLENPAKCRGRF